MTYAWTAAIVLAAAAGILAGWRRAGRAATIALHLAWAGALGLLLEPPASEREVDAGLWVVLTPGATPGQMRTLPAAGRVLALPGAPQVPPAEPVPDLATALRSVQGQPRLHVIGGGLPARDRDAARGRLARFEAAPLPRGFTALDWPQPVTAGSVVRVHGRAEGVPGGTVDLRDPAGAPVTRTGLDPEGRFQLAFTAPTAGLYTWHLRLFDAQGAEIEAVPLPVAVGPGRPLRLQVRAGAPDPEWKYLRRWAGDAGLELSGELQLGAGLALRDGPAAPLVDFGDVDLVLVDERGWEALEREDRNRLLAAVEAGLGLLLRVSGPLPEAVAEDWAALGFRIGTGEAPPPVTLGGTDGDPGPALHAWPLTVEAPDAAPLAGAPATPPFALWQPHGQGRIGLWWLQDAWRLQTSAAGAAYGTLWAGAVAGLARSVDGPAVTVPSLNRVGERSAVCGLADRAPVHGPDGSVDHLLVDPATGPRACAGWWPRTPGWHRIGTAGAVTAAYVLDAGTAPALAAAQTRSATHRLLAGPTVSAPADLHAVLEPWPRWPFFLAWLALTGALWWRERGR